MEFLPDAENNARNVAFLNKTKNQAKKLFKLAKENSLKIEINNLSHAQEILAQINGFPDWHALEKTITNTIIDNNRPKFTTNNNITKSISAIELEKYLNIPILRKSDKVYSFLSVTYLPSNYEDFVNLINSLMNATMFQYNMGFHRIEISIEQHIIESIPQGDYQYFTHSKNIGMDKEQFDSLFKINITPEQTNKKNFGIDINICIVTDENMLEEHIKFCNIFAHHEFKRHFTFNESINDEELQKYKVNDDKSKRFVIHSKNAYITTPDRSSVDSQSFKLEDMLIYHEIQSKNHPCPIEHTKWIQALYLLSQRLHQWKIVVSMDESDAMTKIFKMSHSRGEDATTTNINDKYLVGLFKSLTSTQVSAYSSISEANLKVFSYNGKNHQVLPWKFGIPLMNVTDNSIDYYLPASTLQSSYNTLIFAKPGSGKSLLMNILNLGLIHNATLSKIPRIGIVDIGPSSLSTMQLIKESLPIEKRHLVQSHKIKMSEEYCVNVFDTILGSRFPTADHFDFLTNFLSLLAIDPNQKSLDPATTGLVHAIINEIYQRNSDKGNPIRYEKGINTKVDEAISNIKLNTDYRTTWWEVVDQLFLADKIVEATIAQRYAVPLLSDVIMALQAEKIREIYSKVIVSIGETLIESFSRSITNILIQYKILTKPTVFDISDAKIVSLDLDEVTKSGDAVAQKQSAVIYLLANYILTKNYTFGYDSITDIPYPFNMTTPNNVPFKQYKDYHQHQLEETKEVYKHICYDEFHRVSSFEPIKEQLIYEMRCSRTRNIGVTVASQSIHDFSQYMIELATNIFIMDSGNSQDQSKISKIFNLNHHETSLLNNIYGPRSGKSGVMLAKIITNEGEYTKLLSLPVNPMLLTALSTTSEDVIIKTKLIAILGYWNTIRLISKYYPSGVRKVFEQKKEAALKYRTAQQVDNDNIYQEIMNDMLSKEYKDV